MSNDSPLKGFRRIRPIGEDDQKQPTQPPIQNPQPTNSPNPRSDNPIEIEDDFFESLEKEDQNPDLDDPFGFGDQTTDDPDESAADQVTTCDNCGHTNSTQAKFCGNCGSPLTKNGAPQVSYQVPGQGKPFTNPTPPPTAQPPTPQPAVNPQQNAAIQPQPNPNMPYPHKSKGTARLIEILVGLFVISGAGWIYAGETNKGILLIIISVIFSAISAVLMSVTAGIACVITVPIWIGIFIYSLNGLNKYMDERPHIFRD